MKVIIDRFEGDYAVVELLNGKMINVPRILFENAKENDVINITIDEEETNKRKEMVSSLIHKLFVD